MMAIRRIESLKDFIMHSEGAKDRFNSCNKEKTNQI